MTTNTERMMQSIQEFSALADELDQLSEGCAGYSEDVRKALGMSAANFNTCYTQSVDAAIQIIPEDFVWYCPFHITGNTILKGSVTEPVKTVQVFRPEPNSIYDLEKASSYAPTLPLAICSAVCRLYSRFKQLNLDIYQAMQREELSEDELDN